MNVYLKNVKFNEIDNKEIIYNIKRFLLIFVFLFTGNILLLNTMEFLPLELVQIIASKLSLHDLIVFSMTNGHFFNIVKPNLKKYPLYKLIGYASDKGFVHILEFCKENIDKEYEEYGDATMDYITIFSESDISKAYANGHLDCIKFFQTVKPTKIGFHQILQACLNGHLHLLEYYQTVYDFTVLGAMDKKMLYLASVENVRVDCREKLNKFLISLDLYDDQLMIKPNESLYDIISYEHLRWKLTDELLKQLPKSHISYTLLSVFTAPSHNPKLLECLEFILSKSYVSLTMKELKYILTNLNKNEPTLINLLRKYFKDLDENISILDKLAETICEKII